MFEEVLRADLLYFFLTQFPRSLGLDAHLVRVVVNSPDTSLSKGTFTTFAVRFPLLLLFRTLGGFDPIPVLYLTEEGVFYFLLYRSISTVF
ncbi:hypothetical protein D3C80_1784370 [compost metagenome]